MFLTDLIDAIAARNKHPRTKRARRMTRNRRPLLEPLEGRRLLAGMVVEPPADLGVEVAIDIKPGENETNPINIRSNGKIPVAILGSETLDVTEVAVATVRFGPCEAAPAHRQPGHLEDVNDDGLMDVIVHFDQREIGLSSDATEAMLTGELLDGTKFHGIDSVLVRGIRKLKNGDPPAPMDPPPPKPTDPGPPQVVDQPGQVLDVKPRSKGESPINLRTRGRTPIAILSSEALDATQIDLATIRLNGAEIGNVMVSQEDVDGDGDLDLLLHFRNRQFRRLGILNQDSVEIALTAKLIGSESDSPDVVGEHPIKIVPKRR